MKTLPLWVAAPRAFLYFNIFKSFPRTFLPSFGLFMRRSLGGSRARPVMLVFSISPDQLRVWYFFAKRQFDFSDWRLMIVDSSGLADPADFPLAEVFRFLNLYHGRKIDFFLRRIPAATVMVCDDDKYFLRGAGPEQALLADPSVAAVSLSPRSSYYFQIGGMRHEPMGSYALLFKRDVFMKECLRFQSPRRAVSSYKGFPENAKRQRGYDTADYANERLLLAGYRIPSTEGAVAGFDGLSSSLVLSSLYPKARIAAMLAGAGHYRAASINGAVIRSLYCRARFENLFYGIFGVPPSFSAGFSDGELRLIAAANPSVSPSQKEEFREYCNGIDALSGDLEKHAAKQRL